MSKENFDTYDQDERMYQASEETNTSKSESEKNNTDYSPLKDADEFDNDANRRTLDEEKADEDEDEIE